MSRVVFALLHLFFGGLFVYSGALKALNPASFVMDVRSFALLPDPYAAWFAMFLPWLEMLAGQAVILGFLRSGALLVLNSALVLFLAAIGISAWRGIDIQCGCFGSAGASGNYAELIIRDVLLLALGLFLLIRDRKKSAPLV